MSLEVKNLNVKFNKGSSDEVLALDKINFTCNKSEWIILLGANGSGKSTLMNAIAGNIEIESGQISLNSNDITRLDDYQRAKYIGRIFQNPQWGTAPELTIAENARLASLRGKSKNLVIGTGAKFKTHIQEKLSELGMGLENKLDHYVGSLSGGQRQALTLIMTTMLEPDLLLMDEPTAALDPKSSSQFMEIANRLIRAHGITTIMISHNLKHLEQYGDRVLQFSQGQIIRDESLKSINSLGKEQFINWFYHE